MASSGTDDAADRPLRAWHMALALAFVVAQALLPPVIVLAVDHLPTVFAWQMFARGTPLIRFQVIYDDGRVVLYAPADLVLKDRSDIPFAALLPTVLCTEPGARIVRLQTPDGDRVFACD